MLSKPWKAEAVEIRDNDERFAGKGVLKAVEIIRNEIAECILGLDAERQAEIDRQLVLLDGTSDKSRLGANSILAVSLAIAKASALNMKMPLFRYIGGTVASYLPVPMMNVMNGGAHANNGLKIQEFMIRPDKARTFSEAMNICFLVIQSLKKLLISKNLSTSVGDEGGFAPLINSNEEALKMIVDAIEKSNLKPGKDIVICLDIAANELINNEGQYSIQSNSYDSVDNVIDYYKKHIVGE